MVILGLTSIGFTRFEDRAIIGAPVILGDRLYAPPEAQAAAPRLLLHARKLALFHPGSGQALQFERPAPF